MRKKLVLGAVLFISLGVLLQINTWSDEQAVTAHLASAAPGFTLEDQSGSIVSLSDFGGKMVVLEWLNPDCPFVQRHYKAKTMTTLAEKYGDVVWIAINSTHYMTKEDDKTWVEKYNLSYPILDDNPGKVGRVYGAKTTPHMFIIDKSGILVYQGAIDDDPGGSKKGNALNYVNKALEEIQAGRAVTVSQTKPYGCSVKYSN